MREENWVKIKNESRPGERNLERGQGQTGRGWSKDSKDIQKTDEQGGRGVNTRWTRSKVEVLQFVRSYIASRDEANKRRANYHRPHPEFYFILFFHPGAQENGRKNRKFKQWAQCPRKKTLLYGWVKLDRWGDRCDAPPNQVGRLLKGRM
jgi:hypothetical protein